MMTGKLRLLPGKGVRMKTRAAVLRDVGKDFEIVELDLDEPKAGEVLVRFVASGLCHSDDHLRTGDIPVRYPIVGGHEGAGDRREGGAGRHQARRRRPRGGLVPAGLRQVPVLRPRPDQPVRLGRFLVDNSLPDGTFRYHEGIDRLRADVPARHVLRSARCCPRRRS